MDQRPQPAHLQTGFDDYADARSMPRATRTSGPAVASFVLGIVALLTSLIPIVNNASFVMALLGAVLAVVGLAGTAHGKRTGRWMAVAGLVLAIVSVIAVLASQHAYSDAIDKAVSGPQVASSTSAPAASSAAAAGTGTSAGAGATAAGTDATATAAPAAAGGTAGGAAAGGAGAQELAVGATATLDSGLQVTVTGVDALTNVDGTPITAVRVSYMNAGGDQQAFAAYDWKALTDGGVIEGSAIFLGDDPSGGLLDSGQLVAGGSVDGTVYFEGAAVAAQYYANVFVSTPTATWALA